RGLAGLAFPEAVGAPLVLALGQRLARRQQRAQQFRRGRDGGRQRVEIGLQQRPQPAQEGQAALQPALPPGGRFGEKLFQRRRQPREARRRARSAQQQALQPPRLLAEGRGL